MTYKSQLQLFFHPASFNTDNTVSNSPISLTYTGPHANQQLGTTLRFFLQLLRASLQALPQSTTRVQDLLGLVSSGWDTALEIQEAERRLNLEGPTEARIVSDERLAISASILLTKVRTKVRVNFEVVAAVGEGELSTSIEAGAGLVYGEEFNEKKMTEFVEKEISEGFEGWDTAVRQLREKLVVRGAKGLKK